MSRKPDTVDEPTDRRHSPQRHQEAVLDPNSTDPDVIDALAIKAGWLLKTDNEMNHRALMLARRARETREQAALSADPEHWSRAHRRAQTVGLHMVWPGCPASLDTCIVPGQGWSIDPSGIFFVDIDTSTASFVASPMVNLGDHQFGLMLKGGDWRTIDVPGGAAERDFAGGYSRLVLEALRRAGASFGSTVDRTVDPDHPELDPAVDYALTWLLGTFRGAIVGSPVRRLAEVHADRRRDAAAVNDTPTDQKPALGAAMAQEAKGVLS